MPVQTEQLTLNLPSNIQYPVHPEIMIHATGAEAKDWLSWLQAQAACEDYDRDEPDRFGLGVDARAVFETRGKYTTSPLTESAERYYDLKDYRFWRKLYLETITKLHEVNREYEKLNEWAQELFVELEGYKKSERQEQGQLDLWCDNHDIESP